MQTEAGPRVRENVDGGVFLRQGDRCGVSVAQAPGRVNHMMEPLGGKGHDQEGSPKQRCAARSRSDASRDGKTTLLKIEENWVGILSPVLSYGWQRSVL